MGRGNCRPCGQCAMGRGCAHVWRSVGIASPDDCSCCEFEGCSRHRPRAGSSLADAPRGTGRRSSGASVVVRHDRTRARGRPWRSQPWASRGTPRMRWVCRGPSRPCRARARPARRTISPSGHASRDDVVENERGFALGQPRPRGKPYGKLGCGPVHARCPTDRWSIDNNSPPDRLCQPTWQALAAGFAPPAMRQAQRSVAGNNTAVQSSEVVHDPRQRARGGFERATTGGPLGREVWGHNRVQGQIGHPVRAGSTRIPRVACQVRVPELACRPEIEQVLPPLGRTLGHVALVLVGLRRT
jgi:hypothetical protein